METYWDPLHNKTLSDFPARRGYYIFVCVVLFFLPCVVMSLAYALITWTLWAAQVPGERTSKDIKVQTKLRKKVASCPEILYEWRHVCAWDCPCFDTFVCEHVCGLVGL